MGVTGDEEVAALRKSDESRIVTEKRSCCHGASRTSTRPTYSETARKKASTGVTVELVLVATLMVSPKIRKCVPPRTLAYRAALGLVLVGTHFAGQTVH